MPRYYGPTVEPADDALIDELYARCHGKRPMEVVSVDINDMRKMLERLHRAETHRFTAGEVSALIHYLTQAERGTRSDDAAHS